jgi:hypothetical protein
MESMIQLTLRKDGSISNGQSHPQKLTKSILYDKGFFSILIRMGPNQLRCNVTSKKIRQDSDCLEKSINLTANIFVFW